MSQPACPALSGWHLADRRRFVSVFATCARRPDRNFFNRSGE